MKRKSCVSVYTDGSCDGNPGPGGYAAIVKSGRFYEEVVGKVPVSTNNRMELIAVIKGLSKVKIGSTVTVFCDSQYVVDAVNSGRLSQWQKNGWRRIRVGTTVLNMNEWLQLLETVKSRKLNVKFQKLKAHQGHYFNERADFLARRAAKSV